MKAERTSYFGYFPEFWVPCKGQYAMNWLQYLVTGCLLSKKFWLSIARAKLRLAFFKMWLLIRDCLKTVPNHVLKNERFVPCMHKSVSFELISALDNWVPSSQTRLAECHQPIENDVMGLGGRKRRHWLPLLLPGHPFSCKRSTSLKILLTLP